MKLGFVSAIFPEFSLEKLFDVAQVEGLRTIELMCWPTGDADRKFAGVTHINVSTMSKSRAEEVGALSVQYQVEISGLGFYPNPLHPDPDVSDAAVVHLKKVISTARMLGLDRVNTFIGRDWTKSVDENWPRFLEIWRPIVAFAEDHEVKIGIENCPMLFTRDEWPGGKNLATNPTIWRRMFNDISSDYFGLNYDPSHLALQWMDPISPLREFREKLFHLHAKDVKIDHERLNQVGVFAEPLQWHRPCIPGFGDIDWAKFFATIVEVGYSGSVCIEIEDDTFGATLEGRRRAIKVARNILAPFFAEGH